MRFLGHGLLPCGNTPVATAMCSPPPRLGAVARIRLRLGGRIAQCAIRPLVRGYSLALHTPRLLRLCAHRPRDWGAVARIRLRTSMTAPVLRQTCHPDSRFSELFATISPTLCATIAHSAPNSRRRHGTLYRSKQLGV